MVTKLNEKVRIDRPAREVFAYVADFSTCEEWDSTAFESIRIDKGPLGTGSRFKVSCAAPVGTIRLDYEILEYVPDAKVVLLGTTRIFTVKDTIVISPTPSGCALDYTAEFSWGPVIAPLAHRFREGLERMGRASVQDGLKKALQDRFPAPQISRGNARADRLLPAALSRFTKRGYRLGKRRWNPMSAYVGDKHMVVTGATSGLGKACARNLARRGAELTLVVRNKDKGQALVRELIAATGNGNLHLEIADLSLMADVDRMIASLVKRGRAIDVLVNNAGALFNPRALTSEGLEKSFALLLMSPYRLTEGLYPLLKASKGRSRVINVVSGGLYTQRLCVDDLQNEKGAYSGSVAYARAKRALMVKTEQWAEDWAQDGIVVNAMHPGWADTPGLKSSMPQFHKIVRPFMRTPAEGADTIIWLAVATEAAKVSGRLFLDREPRTTHLLQSTHESREEREALRAILESWNQERRSAA